MSGIIINPYSFATGSAFSSTKSLEFDGVDDNISCGELPVTTTLTAFSFSLWVKVGSTTTRMNLTSSPYNTWNDNFGIYYEAGTTTLKVEQGSNVKYENTSTTLPVGTWTHLCFVFDASESTAATKSKCYINGVSILNASATAFVRLVDLNYDLYLGCRYLKWNGSKYDFYDGNIDEVSFFNIALSSGDVSDIYNSGTPTDLTEESGLVSWYRMGENSTFKTPQILMPEQSNKDKISNYSMAFDGTDDYVKTGLFSDLDGGTTATFSVWVKPISGAPFLEYVFSNPRSAVGAESQFALILYEGTRISFNVSTRTSQRVYGDIAAITYGSWNNIIVTVDLSLAAADRAKIYVNGVDETTSILMGTITNFNTATDGLYIGEEANGSYNPFNGNIDEVSIFDEVKAIGDIWDGTGKPTDLTGESGLVGYWKMGEEATYDAVASEWTIPDQVRSNDGTSANMTIEDRTGDAPDSSNNALSYNMVEADIVEEAP